MMRLLIVSILCCFVLRSKTEKITCGKINSATNDYMNRIVGGVQGSPHEFPWLVSIQVLLPIGYRSNCGGAVLNSRYILTAAHCFIDWKPSGVLIAAGKYNLSRPEGCEQYRKVAKYITDGFDNSSLKNDIALLKLDKPLTLKQSCIAPICLPNGNENYYDYAVLAGWGRESYEGFMPDTMRKVNLKLFDKKECEKTYRDDGYNYYIDDCQICTLDEGKDGCQGDSGGPLMCYDLNTNKTFVCGIVSWGIACAKDMYPGIYTDVNCYKDWIRQQINKK